ncbi:MAG: indole-3-glycerol phosphate synthase TrpC [Steroidobacteraceae bacterium]|jgi:indole-3-glycerol phosphate synthase
MNEDFLAAMARASRQRVARERELCPQQELQARASALPTAPRLTLSKRGFDLIAEVKLRSPASGQLRDGGEDIAARVAAYADAGAAAISVLTEPSRFDGALSHLTRAVQGLAGRIPVMRKDFLVDAYQVYEARVAGAGGVLIILRMLTRAELEALLEAASQLGLFALLEAFDDTDLQLAAELVREYGQRTSLLVGVNCRDLVTLKVVPGRLEALAPLLPRAVPRVAESGVMTGSDAARLAAEGYDVALVGSALMQSADPLELAGSMLAAGRAAARPRA